MTTFDIPFSSKKGISLLHLMVLGLLLISSRASSQWVHMNGLFVGPISCLATDSGMIFAGTQNGLCRSSDSGATWNVDSYYHGAPVSSLFVTDSDFFGGTMYGVFKCVDRRESRENFSLGLPDTAYVSGLEILGDKLFCGTLWGGLYETPRTTAIWNKVGGGLPANNSAYAIHNHKGVMFAGLSTGVFRSADSGVSWVKCDSGILSGVFDAFASEGNDIFAGSSDSGVYRSTDNGISWMQVNSGLANLKVESFGLSSESLYVSTQSGLVYRTTDSGQQWAESDSGLLGGANAFLSFDSEMCAGGMGFYLSTKGGSEWSSNTIWNSNVNGNNFVSYGSVYSMAAIGKHLYAGTLEAGVWLSTDDGEHWRSINAGLTDQEISSLAVDDSSLFAVTSLGHVFYLTDPNETWKQINGLPDCVNEISGNDSILVVTTDTGVFLSINFGKTWTKKIPAVNSGGEGVVIDGNNVILAPAGSDGSHLFMIPDFVSDSNWSLTGITSVYLTNVDAGSFFINNNAVFLSDWGVFQSTDTGRTWSQSLGNALFPAPMSLVGTDSDLFATDGTTERVYNLRLGNGDSIWTDVSGFLNSFVASLAIEDGYLFLGSAPYYLDGGVWRRPLADFHSLNSVPVQTPEISEFSVFPNPATSQTSIRYSSSMSSPIIISIIDPLGRVVAIPLNGDFQEAGQHQIQLNASKLTPGIYICRLTAGGVEQGTKFVVER